MILYGSPHATDKKKLVPGQPNNFLDRDINSKRSRLKSVVKFFIFYIFFWTYDFLTF